MSFHNVSDDEIQTIITVQVLVIQTGVEWRRGGQDDISLH